MRGRISFVSLAALPALAAVLLAAAPAPTPAPSATPSSPPAPSTAATPAPLGEILVRGRYLVCENGFIVLTNGAAFRLADGTAAVSGKLGQTIRLHVDPSTHQVRSVDLSPRDVLPGEAESGKLPAGFATATAQTPPPRAPGSPAEGAAVTVTIVVRTPDDTPLGDDIYLSTERTAYNPAELRLVRRDSRYWTLDLSLPAGSTLRYRFTRGSFATAERDRAGALIPPHVLVASPGLRQDDTVERWADRN